jgi:hypothetical protein
MKRTRLLLLAAVAMLGLLLAAAALAGSGTTRLAVHKVSLKPTARQGYTLPPELAVQQASYKLGAAANPGFLFESSQDNDATAKMTIFSPAGYTSNLTQTPGSTVGKAFALAEAGGIIVPLAGPVIVGNPADATLQAASAQCRNGATTNQEILILNTSLGGTPIQVPDFINTVGPYVTQEICLPPPETAPMHAKVLVASFTINGVFTNGATAGRYEWVGDFTPYAGVTPDVAGTVESRTYVGLPSTFTFKRVKSKSSIVRFAGSLKIQGLNPATIRLRLFYGAKSKPAPNFLNPSLDGYLGTGKNVRAKGAKANGSYGITRAKVKKKTYFQMRLYDEYALDSCPTPSPSGQPIPCLLELISPMTANQITVKPPKKKRRHR